MLILIFLTPPGGWGYNWLPLFTCLHQQGITSLISWISLIHIALYHYLHYIASSISYYTICTGRITCSPKQYLSSHISCCCLVCCLYIAEFPCILNAIIKLTLLYIILYSWYTLHILFVWLKYEVRLTDRKFLRKKNYFQGAFRTHTVCFMNPCTKACGDVFKMQEPQVF